MTNSKDPFDPSSYELIEFTPSAIERFAEVADFLGRLLPEQHPQAVAIQSEFITRLRYLNDYGGPVSSEDPRRRFRVVLGTDFAPLSFGVTWLRLNEKTGEYEWAFNGGLIWHGASNDPLCVSLSAQYWGIHT